MPETLCTIKFEAEAYDFAYAAYQTLIGITVRVYPTKGEMFHAVVQAIADGHERDDGQFVATFAVADRYGAPTDVTRDLNIYSEIAAISVL